MPKLVPATVFLDAISDAGYEQALRWKFIHGNDILVADTGYVIVAACKHYAFGDEENPLIEVSPITSY